jgi:hypothetical protein
VISTREADTEAVSRSPRYHKHEEREGVMKAIDRVILIALTLGIWALVFQPRDMAAHPDDLHSCRVSGEAYGELTDGEVLVHDWNDVSVKCHHH